MFLQFLDYHQQHQLHTQKSMKNSQFGYATMIITNKEIDNTKTIVESLEESGSLIKGTSETIKNVAKEQK